MKITQDEYIYFIKRYYEVDKRAERLGQNFCNTYGITDPKLFYSTDNVFVVKHIFENYIEEIQNECEPDTGIGDETGPFSRGA